MADELTKLSVLAAERLRNAAHATDDRDLANDLLDLAERLRESNADRVAAEDLLQQQAGKP